MSDYKKLGLYEHNIRSYEKVKQQFEKDNIAAIVHATGTGKIINRTKWKCIFRKRFS